MHRKHSSQISGDSSNEISCRFPKFLNKKWKNLRQTKYVFNLNANTLQIIDSNNHSSSTLHALNENVFFKLNCIQSIKSFKHSNSKSNNNYKKRNEFVYLVNNHLEW